MIPRTVFSNSSPTTIWDSSDATPDAAGAGAEAVSLVDFSASEAGFGSSDFVSDFSSGLLTAAEASSDSIGSAAAEGKMNN